MISSATASNLRRLAACCGVCVAMAGAGTAIAQTTAAAQIAAAAPSRTPVNQVFQYAFTAACEKWKDGSKTTATAYLWVPPQSVKLRGLVIMCTNVPEHMLVGHPAIRQACTDNDLGIIWCTPTFMNFRKDMPKEYVTTVDFLQTLLDGLAKTSGFDEIATVPWLPMGESGHLLMVDALMETKPERCIAGMFIKNNHLPPKNRTVPTLVAFGSGQEWAQDKSDIRTKWCNVTKDYDNVVGQCKANPDWPLTYVLDGTSGHFDCSERLTEYFGRYIDAVSKARLPADGSANLRPVDIKQGWRAALPVPGHEADGAAKPVKVDDAAATPPADRAWYFSPQLAAEAQSIAAINWKALTQWPAVLEPDGTPKPYTMNGITQLKSVAFEDDGITFTVRSRLLDTIPEKWPGAGEPLAKTDGDPLVEWQAGQVAPVEGRPGTFRIALDRTYRATATYLLMRKEGSATVRPIVQPINVDLNSLRNNQGQAQKITFDPIADVPLGTESVALSAKSDAGLPVQFFVASGPAIIRDGKVLFTEIPVRAKFPMEVTIGAWQWGRGGASPVKTAEIAKQTFRILPAGK